MLERTFAANLAIVLATLSLPCLAGSAFAGQPEAEAENGSAVASGPAVEDAVKPDATPERPDAASALAPEKGEAKPSDAQGLKGAGPADPPSWYRQSDKKKDDSDEADESSVPPDTPSVARGQPAGIEVGDFAPDFELQPVQPSADLQRWLGLDAPESIERNVMLSKVVGKAPVLLLFGSYT